MGDRPSGTVTFLFTDIEGSTRRWEADPDGMRVALAAHDDVLRSAIDAHGGWMFKHTGDGVCAAFASPRRAIGAAIDAQRSLALPVRMGIATGEAEQRGEDYFGPALNRTARVMAVGHGGQILVSGSTAGVVAAVDLVDLGEHRLRDLSAVEHLFQVRAEGLATLFPPLRTVDEVPGNLPVPATSFIGRDVEVAELAGLVRAHRLVTLTGVGGVGKSRLAIQVAAELVGEFGDGVWLVELAPTGDPAAVPDAVATALGITQQARRSVTESVAEALGGRHLLIVLDNCEHVLDAAADLVEAVLARTSTVTVLATSREGLRVPAEHVWTVPSLDVRGGTASSAVELFVERARAASSGFELSDPAEAEAVAEICRRLDGIALAIELAAARMVSMSAQDVRDRLGDRFRLLSGGRRGLERHQTLRQAVQWSYGLLSGDEQAVLQNCSAFAGGFGVAGVASVGDGFDEYAVLDLLDSLVRKSLITIERVAGHTRYGLLETIRQFAEEQLAAGGTIDQVRDRHARWYARQAVAMWERWDGPGYDTAMGWVEVEFDNLRAGFRWATDQGDVVTASAIAAHTTMLTWILNRFEPVGWAEELLPAATVADVDQLPRLYTAASFCAYTGEPEVAVGYAQTAQRLETDPRYQSFETGWASNMEATAHLSAGRIDRWVDISIDLAAQTGLAHLTGRCGLLFALPAVGRAAEAMALAEDTLAVAHARRSPFMIAYALCGCGRAFTDADPVRALDAFRQGLAYTREHRIRQFEGVIAQDAAALEAVHGDRDQALMLFDTTIEVSHQAGNLPNLAATLANLAVFLDRFDQPEIAATVYGTTTGHASTVIVVGLPAVVDHLRTVLMPARFDQCVATGTAMDLADAVAYARHQIRLARSETGAWS